MRGMTSVGGRFCDVDIRNTIKVSMALTPRVIFSPLSAGTRNTDRATIVLPGYMSPLGFLTPFSLSTLDMKK